jgi:putative drug exporter of the RND superfamily
MTVLYGDPATNHPTAAATRGHRMFSRWGAFVYRFRKLVVIVTVVLGLASLGLASQASGELSSGGWLARNSESSRVQDRLADEFDAGRSSLIVLFRSNGLGDATSPEYQAAVGEALAELRDNEHVTGIVGYAETQDPRFVSEAGDATYAVVQLGVDNESSVALVEELREEIAPPAGLTYQLTGYGPVTLDSAEQSERDLQRAEVVSLPIAAAVLLFVFASLIAAGMPLFVAGLAIPTSLGAIFLVAQVLEMSVFVLNIATMLGLALAIDYSLFIVSRFREELANGRTVALAVERSIATAGKAVAFSGIAVAIGLSGLLVFEAPALRSIGLAGSIVVFCSLFFSLTLLPAVLGMLGPRVNALSIQGLIRRLRGRSAEEAQAASHSRWAALARAVMRRPVLVLVPTLALLLAAGAPFLRLEQGVPGAEIYPAGLESRDAYFALQNEFPRGETSPIRVLATVDGDPLSEANIRSLVRYSAALADVEGIDRVEGPFSGIPHPQTGADLTEDEYVALYTGPQVPPQLQALLDSAIAGSTVRIDAISPIDASQPEATDLIPVVRGIEAGSGIETEVGGTAALAHDFLASQSDRAPIGVAIPLIASGIVLFFLFGSVVIPIKAVIMTLLSITASFGALVWIFQEGNFSNVLAFDPLGYTVAGNPIIMFCVLFGLSMDYEVLLLSRIQEAYRRTGDNTASVAEGLAKTARMITGAALIMIAVFAAFALAEVITIKSIGVGMAIAVALDATIIRVLLVPATMRLMGDWNWWAPGALGRLADRLGFSHAEDEEPASPDRSPAPGLAG